MSQVDMHEPDPTGDGQIIVPLVLMDVTLCAQMGLAAEIREISVDLPTLG